MFVEFQTIIDPFIRIQNYTIDLFISFSTIKKLILFLFFQNYYLIMTNRLN